MMNDERQQVGLELARETIAGSDGPHVLITAGVHGDEHEPMAAVRALIAILRGRNLRGRVTLVPVVNETAYRLGQRTGDDGRDLARTCPGRADGTSTERAADALSALIRTADYYIDLHTGGTRLRVFPLVGYGLVADAAVLNQQRRMARAFGLPVIWGTDPNLEGRSLSVARDARVPAIYAEYHGGGTWDSTGVEAYIHGCLNVLADLEMLERRRSLPISPPLIVEDPRPGAGHMQVNHPAPVEGFFTPSVDLGSKVQAGQPLGVISDLLGKSAQPVPAQHGGMVLVIHARCYIAAGECAGVVLET
ncbi:MAG: succinylglutamate desuccinylase [Planctomycetes bacterium]|nr:succinylglutamate desuccinylase [Planctomycetota bacterium]